MSTAPYDISYRRYFITAAALWTVIIVAVFIWDWRDRQAFFTSNVLSSARTSFEKDLAFRRWASSHGGVYVPETAATPRNPYLNVPERDIKTPSGKNLTLMNPAYMTRQLYAIGNEGSDSPKGHITSLKPIRPENAPDPWEKSALEAFERGRAEVSELQMIDGVQYFRFMRPLKAEKPCLKCHAEQGYKEGEVRGGISVSLPVSDLLTSARESSVYHLLVITAFWLFGLAGFWYGLRRLQASSSELQQSEERYRQQFQQSQAFMLIIDPESGAIVDANPAACEFYGYSHQELTRRSINELNIRSAEELAACISGVMDGSKRQFSTRHILADGSIRDVEVYSCPVSFRGKTLLQSILFDISSRLAAEQELRQKTDFAENLVRNSTSPTFVLDVDHTVLIWNRAIEELTGITADEVVGTMEHWRAFYKSSRPCLADVVLDDRFEESKKLYDNISRSNLIPDGLHAEGDYTFDSRRSRLIFSAAPIRDREGKVIAAIETLEDITERISLEAQLYHAQKMESVGTLAGGIAHDFNNVLTVISGYADLLKLTLPDDRENLNIAGEISASVDRAANMTRSLLAFSGKSDVELQYDDLNQILASVRKSLGRLIREDIRLTVNTCEEWLRVYVDRVQIEQVLINLVINARDALDSGGEISITTGSELFAAAHMEGNTVIPAGRYACLSVSDNGTGIDHTTLKQIFEPFFTTKGKDKGTGLGLAITHTIVAKHNGYISVRSTPGHGTEFRIYLPQMTGEHLTPTEDSSEATPSYGMETILVVEDDTAIMKLLQEILGRFGYQVLAAADGVEAIELFSTHAGSIQIALVDVIMPRMNGREVVEHIRKQKPEMPIIMTSGYTDEVINRAEIESLNVVFLQKPVKPFDLLGTIGRCLNNGSEGKSAL